MADNTTAEFVGVKVGSDGIKDFSHALRVVKEQEVDAPGPLGLQAVIQRAAEVGVNEQDLISLRNRLSSHAGVRLERRIDVNQFSKVHGLKPDEALGIVRDYAKEKVKEAEEGTLNHYHQMPVDRIDSVVADRALLSTDMQKALGRKTGGTARPDVVQMTRDRYDAQGNLVRGGLGSANLTGEDMATWVFKPGIMELPGYDCTGEYPDLPSIPLQSEYIEAVLISSEHKVGNVQSKLEAGGIQTRVLTQDAWKQEYPKH